MTPRYRHRSGLVALCADKRGSGTLIGLLAAVVIIAILALLLLGGPQIFQGNKAGSGGAGAGQGRLGGAIAARNTAKDTVCRNNLSQLRMAIQIFLSNGEGNPQSLEQLQQDTPGLQLKCPVTEEPYEYDPATGSVRCLHPAHQRY